MSGAVLCSAALGKAESDSVPSESCSSDGEDAGVDVSDDANEVWTSSYDGV